MDFLVPPRCVQYTGPWEPDSMSPYLVERESILRAPRILDRAKFLKGDHVLLSGLKKDTILSNGRRCLELEEASRRLI